MEKPYNSKAEKTTYTINGRKYYSIEEVPAEYRDLIAGLEKNATNNVQVTVTKQFETNTGLPGTAEGSHRAKFLHEAVLPNLHLMDDKAKAEILRALSDTPKRVPAPVRQLLWIVLYAVIGIILMMAFNALKNILNNP